MTIEDLRARYPDAETFSFGDSEELCNWLLHLIRDGKKTSTCGALRDFGQGQMVDGVEALPTVGRRDIALNWDGTPALVIETVEVQVVKFRDVTERFALDEGEDETLADWRAGHRAYFERNGGWSEDMDVVCEWFKVIEDFGATPAPAS